MKKLPKVFQNDINKSFNNNKEYFYSGSSNEVRNSTPLFDNKKSIDQELDNIFNGIGYPFNDTVIIKTPNETYETNLIYRSSSNIMTIDNDNIPISSIISLQRKTKE